MTGIPGEELSDPTPSFYEETSMVIKPHDRNPSQVCKWIFPVPTYLLPNNQHRGLILLINAQPIAQAYYLLTLKLKLTHNSYLCLAT